MILDFLIPPLNGRGHDLLSLAGEAERLGYRTGWIGESYGGDAATVMAWVAATTTTLEVGSAVFQIPGRTPAMTAMTAASLDAMSGGRVRVGLGVSGPQVSEGWHGVGFGKPMARTRDYVEVVRLALSGQKVRHEGVQYPLPLPGGEGKPMQLLIVPARPIPIYLSALGPRNLQLAGEVADGWLGMFASPDYLPTQLDQIRLGLQRSGRDAAAFDFVVSVPAATGGSLDTCVDALRPRTARYLGGMGSRRSNFYNDLATAMGFGEAADKVRDLYLERRHAEAEKCVPREFIEATSLLGSAEQMAPRIAAYQGAGITAISVLPVPGSPAGPAEILRTVAEAAEIGKKRLAV